jgi:hypothetical protein
MPFEAALAALAPRVEGFDRERLIFLAGQAAALRGVGVSPAGDCPDFCRAPAQQGGKNWTVPFSSPRWRWAWPAAFSAMTTVAASLLVILCTRSAPTIASSGAEPRSAASNVAGTPRVPKATAVERRAPETSRDTMPDWVVAWISLWKGPAQPAENSAEAADAAFHESDPALRAELRRRGIDFRQPQERVSRGTTVIAEGPMTYYQLLNRLQGKGPAGQGGLKEMMQ